MVISIFGLFSIDNIRNSPFLIMAPGLFTAAFTLGVMMQVVNAFGEVKDAFSVFLYNWTRITELRSIHKRLMEFENSINYQQK